jgi:outer membrane receptor protein involved in Fe transport
MSNRSSGIRRAIHLLCTLGAAGAGALVQAQTPADDAPLDEVIVTGSRIARPNLESAVPVTTVQADELYETGSTSVGDLLNDLPALRSTFSQSNSSRFLGTTGLNLLDLRGLGTQRTLVLVNGRRHVGADILGNAVSPDTNTFPTDLIERIDVVTGGNSAVYGSDAIGGVVNFILKKDFTGLQFRGQGGETTTERDAGNYYGSVLAGTNFLDDRGNIAVNLEYAKQEPFFASDRQNLRRQGNFVIDDADPPDAVNGSDGVPDRNYYGDIRNTTSDGGTIFVNSPMGATSGPCGVDPQGAPYSCAFIFQPDGSLVPQTGQRIGLAPLGNWNGGNGTNNRARNALAIYPKLERYSVNVFGNLELSESFAPYIEAKYIRTNSVRFGQPAFFTGSTIDGDRERPRFDNPFITDANRATINAARVAQGLAPITNGATALAFRKNLLDVGNREEDAKRETTRFVVGAAGGLGESWKYDVSVNWGRFKEDTRVKGNVDSQKFALAMDSVRNGAGQIVCRSQIDTDAAYGYGDFLDDPNTLEREPAAQFADARLAGDIANCVPLNPFGEGNITQAMKDYILDDTTSVGEITEFVVGATVTGDSSPWFSLPAGPVGVAFGVEHRTEENYFIADPVVRNGLTFYNALQTFDPPKFKVSEVFTEFRVPLLKEKTAADELTLNLAARFADYDGSTGGVLAYNAGLEWAPIDSLRVRAGLARAVRAPSLADLHTALGQNFEAAPLDPCSLDNRGNGSPTREANCAAAGVPADYNFTYTSSIEMRSGGNPLLKEESSDSFTAGVVWQPDFLQGFSFSADYFDIEIDDVITAPTAQDIMNACYDAPSLDNQFCGLFVRNGAGAGPLGEQPYQILQGSLQQITLNYASSKARGIDFEVGYNHDVGPGKLNTRLVYTRMLQRDDFLNPAAPNEADQILLELGDPRDAFNLNADYAIGKFKLGYQLRYIGKMVLNFYEDTHGLQGNPPTNADYANVRFYGEVFYHDVRASYDITDSVNAYLGVDNATNRIPPYGLTGTGAGSGIYESRGRFAYAGVKVQF